MKVLVSLGGNAILKHGQKGTAEEQEMNVHNTAKHLAAILRRVERMAITHGNGPQVGNILLQNEIEKETIIRLFETGTVVISVGGGGVPVMRDKDGSLRGVEAVLDKDRTAALLGKILGVETLLILTDVEKVFINYGKPDQRALDSMTLQECKKYLAEGQFPAGSMGPKIESAVSFLSGSSGRSVVIASLEKAEEALKGIAGTTITNQ